MYQFGFISSWQSSLASLLVLLLTHKIYQVSSHIQKYVLTNKFDKMTKINTYTHSFRHESNSGSISLSPSLTHTQITLMKAHIFTRVYVHTDTHSICMNTLSRAITHSHMHNHTHMYKHTQTHIHFQTSTTTSQHKRGKFQSPSSIQFPFAEPWVWGWSSVYSSCWSYD